MEMLTVSDFINNGVSQSRGVNKKLRSNMIDRLEHPCVSVIFNKHNTTLNIYAKEYIEGRYTQLDVLIFFENQMDALTFILSN